MKAALTEGTPGLNPEDLQLPTLPPVDEEVRPKFVVSSAKIGSYPKMRHLKAHISLETRN